jgi:hypothetical protein
LRGLPADHADRVRLRLCEPLLVVVYDRTKDGATAHCTEHLPFGDRGQVVEGKAFYGA